MEALFDRPVILHNEDGPGLSLHYAIQREDIALTRALLQRAEPPGY